MGKEKKNLKKNNWFEFLEMIVIVIGFFILWNKVLFKWVFLILEKVYEVFVVSVIRWYW